MLSVQLAIFAVCHHAERPPLTVANPFLLQALSHLLTFEFDGYKNEANCIINKHVVIVKRVAYHKK